MTGLNKMRITKLCFTKFRYHHLVLNLLLLFYLIYKLLFDSFKSIYRPFSKSSFKSSFESSFKSTSQLFSQSSFKYSTESLSKSFSSLPVISPFFESTSIKKLNKIYSSKWQFLVFLYLIFNCFGQLNANPPSRSASLSFNSSSNLSSNLSFYLTDSQKNETVSTNFSSYLMSFFLSILNNKTHNQVINQLSILNQPSNSPELELFKLKNSLNNKNIKEIKEINEQIKLRSNKNEIKSNSSVTNESTKDQSINGNQYVPLHKLMHKDEMKLFFNDLYTNLNTNLNNDLNNDLNIKEINQNGSSINHSNDQLINQNSKDNYLNEISNDELSDYLNSTSFLDQNSKNLNEDYELLETDEIKSYPNIFKTKFKNPKQLRLSFKLFNELVELDLELNNQLFSPNFSIQKSESKLSKNLELTNLNCFYHGRLRTILNKSTNLNDFETSTKRSSNSTSSEHLEQTKQTVNSIVSLSICNHLRGFIQTEHNLYIINPLTEQLIRRFNLVNQKQLNTDNVLLIKRTKTTDLIQNLTKQITNQVLAKKVNDLKNKTQNEELIRNDEEKSQLRTNIDRSKDHKRTKRNLKNHNSRLDPTIELAVFADEALYLYLKNTYFIKTDHQIVTFILTILNGIQTLYNQFQKYDINLKFNIVLLEIMQKQSRDLIPSDLQEKYLFRFCDWQAKRKYANTKSKYGNWDHSILLTGLDLARYDKETKTKVDSVIGSALVGSMCKENSCSIGEGTLLGAVVVMSHEIGHSMDLSHDGDIEHSGFNNCENEKYIMTSSLGPGVYLFSKCSARELKSYLKKPSAKCLFVNNSKIRLNKKFLNDFHITDEDDVLGSWDRSKYLPGQVYSIDEQCALQFGSKSFYAPTKYYSLCEAVTCRLNSTFEGIRYAHPTLEGTVCGHEKWCKKGECIAKSSLRETDSKDILNNEIISSNPYSIDLSTWKSDKRRQKIQLNKATSKQKPKWQVFENNYDTSVNQILLNSRLKNNLTVLNTFSTNSNLTNYWISLFDKKNENNGLYFNSLNDLKNFNSLYQNNSNTHLIIDSNNDFNSDLNNQGWSNWSMWSECVSECIITSTSDQDRIPIGFHVSTRKCLSNSGCLAGSRIRLKLCDSTKICSSTNRYHLKTLNQYVNDICSINGGTITNQQSSESTVNGCFIKSCPNNEIILSHELQLPNTSPCSVDGSTGSNSYCFNGECRHFDCSGFSETNTIPCKDKTIGFVAVEEEEEEQINSINVWHPLSHCKQSCLYKSHGIQLAYQDCGLNECKSSLEKQSFQLCSTAEEDCLERELRTVNDYANEICRKYKLKYPTLLSGKGKQLAPRKDNLHSACVVSCSDLNLSNVYYEMNNILDGQLPLGTNCTFNSSIKSYCINGKCVQFGNDLTPIDKSINTFKNLRREFTREMLFRNRHRRSINE